MADVELYDLRLPAAAIEIIGEHLRRGTYDVVAPVLNEIQAQCDAQDRQAGNLALQDQVRGVSMKFVSLAEKPAA